MNDSFGLFAKFLSQQKELGMPDYILSAPFVFSPTSQTNAVKSSSGPATDHSFTAKKITDPLRNKPSALLQKKGPVLYSAAHLHGSPAPQETIMGKSDTVREELVALYNANKTCMACGLGALRKNFVFGSGNPHAYLMVIGEAPGADEDMQGLPFVGKAGELLTKMLSAIKLDRKTDVFIANVLKCRPPDNRNPESSEVMACKHILLSQISIIKPKIILLLGRIAAHNLLDTNASIAALRKQTHSFQGIQTFVTYHPASLLRNEEYKRPAWEDMQKVQRVLSGETLEASNDF